MLGLSLHMAKKKKVKVVRVQSPREEVANWISHGIGVLLIFAFFPLLLQKAMALGKTGFTISTVVFGFGMVMAYLASTLYHYVSKESTKKILRIWDHIGIFLLIGGTYAPIVSLYTSETTATYFFAVMWTTIVAGSVLKLFFTGKYEKLSVGLYLILGWMLVFIYQPLQASMPAEVFYWILAGGLSYSVGVIFYRWHALQYHHAIWHLFVLAGTAFHFTAIYLAIGM